MHLFITSVQYQGDRLLLDEPRVVHHMKNVLRMQPGEVIQIQDSGADRSTRWQGQVVSLSPSELIVKIQETVTRSKPEQTIAVAVALPNKSDKLAVIVQKLTEVGVDQIIFRPAQRSGMRTLESKTLARLEKIVLEATEQSKRWFVPTISYVKEMGDAIQSDRQRCLFDQGGQTFVPGMYRGAIVGPEGGFTVEEKQIFTDLGVPVVDLGETVLRMETAAIVGGWLLKNS